MNEIAIAGRPAQIGVRDKKEEPAIKTGGDFRRYLLLLLLAILGYLLKDWEFTSPEEGVGYWLGIVGGSLMLFLLLYPLRKRVRFLRLLGSSSQWFRLHMLLGLVGPLLVLYHCNFSLGSFNSRVSLYCMLLVVVSGLIGQHIYASIHRGLYGKKTSLRELQEELGQSLEKSEGLAKVTPRLVARLNEMSAELQGCEITQSLGFRRSLKWMFTQPIIMLSLFSTARRELRAVAICNNIVARNHKRFLRASYRHIRSYTHLMGRVARFSFYERLFAVWHVMHYPIFLLMILSALFHVLAVHMY